MGKFNEAKYLNWYIKMNKIWILERRWERELIILVSLIHTLQRQLVRYRHKESIV